MNVTKSEWERIYDIEDTLKVTPNKDVEFLLYLIRKENTQQDMINNFIELPQKTSKYILIL